MKGLNNRDYMKKIYKSFPEWANDYDREHMGGIGGCSLNYILEYSPAWDARQAEIDELKEIVEKIRRELDKAKTISDAKESIEELTYFLNKKSSSYG